jgi:hypothetical protein
VGYVADDRLPTGVDVDVFEHLDLRTLSFRFVFAPQHAA